MTDVQASAEQSLPNGVMFNAYPDSIGKNLADIVELLHRPEFKGCFSLFYVLPTMFHSDLDRGFSIIDYGLNEELVSREDLDQLKALGVELKVDLVLNHLSVRSPQFQDLLEKGDESDYRDFFIDWDKFWEGNGETGAEGQVTPHQEHLQKLFVRKPGLPVLRVRFKDGTLRKYWNTFYQKIDFDEITAGDFDQIEGMVPEDAQVLADHLNIVIKDKGFVETADLVQVNYPKYEIIGAVSRKGEYLGQMDLNARSEKVWAFYDETLRRLSEYGARIIRLDAFAYLHKEPGQPNFFNRPGTWEYLERLRGMARRYGLTIFPEIHAEYGAGIHEEISREGYPVYDFFFPALVIDALDRADSRALLHWIGDIRKKGIQTINMLGCHDGIPVLDLRGKRVEGTKHPGLLSDRRVNAIVKRIIERGGITKDLYNTDGKKIDYYQVNATFFSALGEDERKLLLARAIQMFMPGIPQVWYLDLFAGTNDYAAAKRGRTAGHKEINRTTLKAIDIENGLKRLVVRDQLRLIRLRNTSAAFGGEMTVKKSGKHHLHLAWQNGDVIASLEADLRSCSFTVTHGRLGEEEALIKVGD